MPHSYDNPEPETAPQQETGGDCNPHLPRAPKCYTCEGLGKRPTCYSCGTALYRNSFTDGWFCCVRCEEARTKETTDFLAANVLEHPTEEAKINL